MSDITDIRPRLRVPATARPGEVITLRCLTNHPMFSGLSLDADGQPITRHILERLSVSFNGTPLFEADLAPGIAANPYFEFDTVATQSGTFDFLWQDDRGREFTARASIEVA